MSEALKHIAELSPETLDLLMKRLEEKISGNGASALRPGPEGIPQPLSFPQQRLWFIEQLKPGNHAYNVPTPIRFQGSLDVGALEHSLNEIVRRHSILRTVIQASAGEPAQVVRPFSPLRLPVISFAGAGDADAELRKLMDEEVARPFDLASGPLFRAVLFRLTPDDHILLLVMHHVVFDGWSVGILLNEMVAFYRAFAGKSPVSLPGLPIQYSDFARWQHEWLQGETLASLLSYWRQTLQGAPSLLELPADHPRPAVQSLRGAAVGFALSAELTAALKRLSQLRDTTLFMTLLAAFKVLLFRYTGQTDLVIGTPVANRHHVELENLIGFFVNTVVLRTEVRADLAFADLLGRVREVTLDAFAHQELPFEKLVDELHVERTLSHPPLVQVVFGLHNVPLSSVKIEGLTISEVPLECKATKYDLTLSMFHEGEQLKGLLEYNTDLFGPETATRLTSHFINLLDSAVADPLQPISRMNLLSEPERSRLLTTAEARSTNTWAQQSLHQIFEQTAANRPEAVAVSFGEQQISYGELNRRANRLAHKLRAAGVRRESIVGVLLGRSVEMMVAVLGILKAGGAYLPLEPDLPEGRVRYMLEDSGAGWVVTREKEKAEGKLASYGGMVLSLEEEAEEERGAEEAEDLRSEAGWENAAYVIYTSGSTGKAKGVVVTHGNVVRLFRETERWYEFGEADVWTLYHSYAFDFSVWEMWGALLYGGRLVVVPQGVSRNPEAMLDLLRRERVTVLNQTPSAFRQLVEAEGRRTAGEEELCLRWVIFGGEALDFQSLQPWFERHGEKQPRLINMYGITETTVHTTYRPVGAAEAQPGAASFIGGPIPDLQIYILDEYLQPVPVGVPGEICIGGGGLARGYLNRAALTAERFVPNPFSNLPGDRLYRSGDLGRYRNNLDVEYLGRIDSQVKVRGFRIELGEIESVLSRHPAVNQAVVVARTESGGERRLVAYVVCQEGNRTSADEFRDYLKGYLPEYMVPSAFVLLPHLPLTPNGKVDRRALPAPGSERPEMNQAFTAPRTPVEESLAYIFAQVLGLDHPGVEDNFFALGGDSIRSVRVLALARERGLHFSLEQLFANPTIAELARTIDLDRSQGPEQPKTKELELVSSSDRSKFPDDVEDAYPLTLGQAGLFYHALLAPDSPMYHNVDSMCFRVPRLDFAKLQEAVDSVVARHPILRTSFDLNNFSEPLQFVHRSARLVIGFDDLRHLAPAGQQHVLQAYVEAEKHHRFDLARPPLLRFHVHQLADDVIELTQTELHAIHDGWSMNSMLVEIFHNYADLLAGKTPAVHAPLASSFREFVLLEREAQSSETGQRFWDSKLSECVPLQLPAKQSGKDSVQTTLRAVPVSTETCQKLKSLARRAAVPFKSVLMASHLKALSLLSGQTDILTGMISHGRPEVRDGEQVRGFFLNTVPFRQKLRAMTWMDLARETFRSEMELLPYRRVPLSALQKKWGKAALLETTFNFIDFHVLEQLDASGIELLGIPYGINQTHFALSASFNMNKRYWGAEYPDASLVIALQYDEARFSSELAGMAAWYYGQVLEAMAADPLAYHTGRSFLPVDQELKIAEWNKTGHPAVFRPAHEIFEEMAALQPAALAVSDGKVRLSYSELNRRANQMAHYLQRSGVGPETVVAVLLERSAEMVVAFLAILKAGGAYLPLDVTLPPERLAFQVKDARAASLITASDLAEQVRGCGCPLILADAEAPRIKLESTENPPSHSEPGSLAYVIYTSGSSGKPKGVEIEHGGLTNLIMWYHRVFQVTPADRMTQLASPLFDATVLEIWPCLSAGASLHVMDNAARATPSVLAHWLADQGITLSFLPTVLTEAFLNEPWPAHLRLRTLLTGGDKLHRAPRKPLPFSLYNLYGPTENSVCATYTSVAASDNDDAPPIGRPLDNVQTYILDPYLQPMGIGVPGELCIGGTSLAREYLRRPDLTADSFPPNPFAAGPGERIYRTGDLARYTPTGDIEFLGRLDTQAKVRGFRIELGEIEVALRQHPALRDAVVLVREVESDKMLVAYFVPRDAAPSVTEIRSYLRERLPEYMVPSAYVRLAQLPLTHSGKIDRVALPEPPRARPEIEGPYEMPRTELERQIAAVWQDVLRLETLGVHDNFFDLGGDSIRMIQIHGRLLSVLGREISMMDLFHCPTISALALRLSQPHQQDPSLLGSHQRGESRKRLAEQRQLLRRRQS